MNAQNPIDLAGGTAEVARLCGVSSQAVSQWRSKGAIPPDRCPAIESATGGAVRCEDLLPDVTWQRDDAGNVTGYVVPVAFAEAKAA